MAYKRKKGKAIVNRKKKSFSYNGVDYKSGLEKNMAQLLTEAGISFKYEPKSFEVLPSFNFPFKSFERQSNGKGDMIDRGGKKVRGITYTPDFVGEDFIIETKGYANESFPMRWKMFKKMLTDSTTANPETLVVYKPQKISECKEVVELIKKFRDERKEN